MMMMTMKMMMTMIIVMMMMLMMGYRIAESFFHEKASANEACAVKPSAGGTPKTD